MRYIFRCDIFITKYDQLYAYVSNQFFRKFLFYILCSFYIPTTSDLNQSGKSNNEGSQIENWTCRKPSGTRRDLVVL